MIVQDKLDPSGMFSKAGRLSLEMYTMLQEKDLILNGKRKETPGFESGNSSSLGRQHSQQLDDRHRSFWPRGSTIPEKKSTQSAQQLQPFSKITSRDYCLELLQKQASNNQKFGMYSPKFHMIYEKSSLYPYAESEELKQRAREFQIQNLHYNNNHRKAREKQQLRNSQPPLKSPNQGSLQDSQVAKSMILGNRSGDGVLNASQISPNASQILQHSISQQHQIGAHAKQLAAQSGAMSSVDSPHHSQKGSSHADQLLNGEGHPHNLSQSIVIGDQIHSQSPTPQVLSQRGNNNNSQIISESSVLGIEFDKPQRKIIGPLSMDKQSSRKPMMSSLIPHDKRFEYLEIPQNYSKSVRLPKITFDKQTREQNIFGAKSGGLDYDVKFSQVMPRTDQGVLDYQKLTERKFPIKPVYTMNESIPNDNYFSMVQSKSQIFKKVPAPKFNKMAGRDSHQHDSQIQQFDIDSHNKSSIHK